MYTKKHILFVIRYRSSKILLCSFFITGLLLLIMQFPGTLTSFAMAPLKQRVIVIDPGHGGIDGGTNCPGFLEKDINLSIALKLKSELQKNGAKVILTRERDTDLHNQLAETITRHRKDLLARINIIKNSKPDLFISLHVNSNPRRPSTTGPMVFYNRRVPASFTLAETVQEHLNRNASKYDLKNHSAHSAEYYLLNHCSVPGVLVELGFITNAREQQLLKKDNYQLVLAKTLASSIVSYFDAKPEENSIKKPASVVSGSNSEGLVVYFPQKNSDTLGTDSLSDLQQILNTENDTNQNIRTAVERLIAGPVNANLEPIFNPNSRLLTVSSNDGITELNFSRTFDSFTQGSYQEFRAINALVETVCQFPDVNGIRITIEGEPRSTLGLHIDTSKVLVPENPKLKVAFVIDDLAGSNRGLEEMVAINKPLTMAIMPKRETTRATAELVHKKGYPIFLHLPMEPEYGKASWLGDGAIMSGMSPQEAARQVEEDLAEVPYVIGMNNHMGSKITKRKDIMKEVLKVIKAKHLIVLDSKTTQDSVIPELAREMHIPLLERAIFLDDVNSVDHVRNQIRKLAKLVKIKGSAVAIGHVGITGKNTAAGLAEMIPWLEEQGIEPVFAWQLLK